MHACIVHVASALQRTHQHTRRGLVVHRTPDPTDETEEKNDLLLIRHKKYCAWEESRSTETRQEDRQREPLYLLGASGKRQEARDIFVCVTTVIVSAADKHHDPEAFRRVSNRGRAQVNLGGARVAARKLSHTTFSRACIGRKRFSSSAKRKRAPVVVVWGSPTKQGRPCSTTVALKKRLRSRRERATQEGRQVVCPGGVVLDRWRAACLFAVSSDLAPVVQATAYPPSAANASLSVRGATWGEYTY